MTARLQVWHQLEHYKHGAIRVWYYRVSDDDGRTLAADNSCGGYYILELGLRTLAAFHRLEHIGYTVESLPRYQDLVDKAASL